jgi:hypothetical protein
MKKLRFPKSAGKFTKRNIYQEKIAEQDMHRPEMRPVNLVPYSSRSGCQILMVPKPGQKFFQELHDQSSQTIDGGFPEDVVDQRGSGKAVDQRNLIGQKHDFTHQQGADAGREKKTGKTNMIIFQKELFGIGNNIKGHEKEEGGTGKLQQLLFHDLNNFRHNSKLLQVSLSGTYLPGLISITKFKKFSPKILSGHSKRGKV